MTEDEIQARNKMRILQARNKMRIHLLGEAFPTSFSFTVVIERNPDGSLQPIADVICAPANENEFQVMKMFLRKIGLSPR